MKLTKKWFTLVEMLIVIVIIGILAAAIFPKLTGIQGRARDTARKAEMNQFISAMAVYQIDKGSAYRDNYTANAFANANTVSDELVNGGYLKSGLKDPSNYEFGYTSNGSVFGIASFSEVGEKNANWGASTLGTANTIYTIDISTDNDPGEATKKLCGSVSKKTNGATLTDGYECNKQTSTAPAPVYVQFN